MSEGRERCNVSSMMIVVCVFVQVSGGLRGCCPSPGAPPHPLPRAPPWSNQPLTLIQEGRLGERVCLWLPWPPAPQLQCPGAPRAATAPLAWVPGWSTTVASHGASPWTSFSPSSASLSTWPMCGASPFSATATVEVSFYTLAGHVLSHVLYLSH